MDVVWQELIKALPWGFVLLVMRYLEIRENEKQMAERASNAADKARVEREFEMEKNKLWMETIKTVLDRQTEASKQIVSALTAMQKDLEEKYDSMAITKDLLDAARRELARRKVSD